MGAAQKKNKSGSIFRVILLGEFGVGKTNIITRFVENTFKNYTRFFGREFFIKTMTFNKAQGKTIKHQIWDTACQERYRPLTKSFYTNTGVAILVYDITKKETFNKIKNYWYNEIKENIPRDISKIKYI